MCARQATNTDWDRGRAETEGECSGADKEVIVHVLRLIAAHLHPELAAAETPTSAQDPGVNSTIKTSMAHKN